MVLIRYYVDVFYVVELYYIMCISPAWFQIVVCAMFFATQNFEKFEI